MFEDDEQQWPGTAHDDTDATIPSEAQYTAGDGWPGQEWPGTEVNASGGAEQWPGQEWPGTEVKSKPEVEAPLPRYAREAAHGVLPAAGMGLVAGAVAGAGQAYYGAPLGLPGVLGAGLVGAVVGGYLGSKADQAVTHVLGVDDEAQRAVNAEADPYGTMLAGMAPMAGNPMMVGKTLGQQAAARGLNAGVMGAFDATQQLVTEGHIDPAKVAVGAAFGAAFPNGNAATRYLHGVGERAGARYAPGRPDTQPGGGALKADADTSQSPSVAGNNALAQQPAAPPKAEIGYENSAAAGGERYGKDAEPSGTSRASYGDMDPTLRATLLQSLESNAVVERPTPPAPERPQPRPEPELPPQVTGDSIGLVEAHEAQQAARPAPPPDPLAARYAELKAKYDTLPPRSPEARALGVEINQIARAARQRDAAREQVAPPAEPVQPQAEPTAQPPHELAKIKEMGKGLTDSLYDHLWSRVEAGRVNESDKGAPTAFLQGAKKIRDSGGLQTREELKAYAQEQAVLDNKSPTFQQDMRALVEKYTPKAAPAPEAALANVGEIVPKAPRAQAIRDKADRDMAQKLRGRGMEDRAIAFENTPPEQRGELRTAIRDALRTNKRVVNELGRTVSDETTATKDRQNSAIRAVAKAYEAHAPVENETGAQLHARLLAAVDTANTAHGGNNPVHRTAGYRPNPMPADFKWFDTVKIAAQKRPEYWTPERVAEFKAKEALIREGSTQNPDAVDAGIGMNRRGGGDAADRLVEKQGTESPENEILDRVNLVHAEKALTELEPFFRGDAALEDLSPKARKIVDDMPKDVRKAGFEATEPDADPVHAEKVRAWLDEYHNPKEIFARSETHEQETDSKPIATRVEPKGYDSALDKFEEVRKAAEQSGEAKRAEGAKPKPIVEIKGSKVDPAERTRIMAEMAKAEARDQSRKVPGKKFLPKEKYNDEVRGIDDKPIEDKDSSFWNDQRGELDLKKVHQSWRALQGPIKTGLTKYLGVPISDIQKSIDRALIYGVTAKEALNKRMRDTLDGRWRVWGKEATPDDVLRYLTTIERPGNTTRPEMVQALRAAGLPDAKAEWMADEASFHRDVMKQVFEFDRELLKDTKGAYEAIENYVTHIFEDVKGAQKFIDERIKNLGPTWFQKERTFETLQEAIKAGFKLKFDNPIDILGARWKASINAAALLDTARRLQRDKMAFPAAEAPKGTEDWVKIGRLPDRQEWLIHPEGEYLWKNAMEAKGLAERDDTIGSIYRGWMQVKNVWTPIKLMASAFHEVHVLGIHFARNAESAVKRSILDPANTHKFIGEALKNTMTEPLLGFNIDKLPLVGKALDRKVGEMFGTSFSKFEGRRVREEFGKDLKDIADPVDRMYVAASREAGFSPFQSHEEIISAKRALEQALDKHAPAGIAWHGFRRAIEMAQDPMFKYQIPALKYMAFKRAFNDLIVRDPSLASDAARRGEALREIGKNIDDTYGEMFYKGMFWNKTLKDIGIGTHLSLSWQVGQWRQVIGFGRDVGKNVAGAAMQLAETGNIKGATARYRTPSQLNKYNADSKLGFVASYVATSMLIAGAMSWALSGELPKGLDYVFPRNGRGNPDGTPQRLSPPFNTREPFMAKGHMEEHNSVIGGMQQFLWNKMVLQPLVEVAKNKDFYGNKLWDDQAPWYKRALQGIDSILGANFSPISVSGATRAKQEGGGLGSQALALGGFAPAAKYLNHSALENRITGAYHGTFPEARPYQYGPKTGLGRGMVQGAIRWAAGDPLQSEARQDATARLRRAIVDKDPAAAAEARRDLASPEKGNMGKVAGKIDPSREHEYQFSRLGKGDQISIGRDMNAEDFQKYVVRNPNNGVSKAIRAQLMRERGLI